MARILVTEQIADRGLDRLRSLGHDVDVQLGRSDEEVATALPGASALIIRSSTQVTADLLAVADELVVVGRAGIGLDNVDVDAATNRGVIVANAPESNILSAAEHTMAMLLSQARNIPQAHAALSAGRWERSKWEGVELADKTLGIIGLGRIGALVAERAAAFGMQLVGHDPYVSAERARKLGIELVDLNTLVETADFITIHVARTPETVGLIGEEQFSRAKPELRIVNVARGGIVDEAALADAVGRGRIAGAALDVFVDEPLTESPLFDLPSVVVTPHLGASTVEAQDKAGEVIAEQVALALANDYVPFAVNVNAGPVSEEVRPYLALAERLGRLWVGVNGTVPEALEFEIEGQLAGADTRVLTLAVLKGAFGRVSGDPVSFVNAPLIAESRGVEVRETRSATSKDYVTLLRVGGGARSVAGTVVGLTNEARLVALDGNKIDIPPSDHMLVLRNDDRPGMIGLVGGALGQAGVNIDDMAVGKDHAGAPSLMILSTSGPVPSNVVDQIRNLEGIVSAIAIS